VQVEEGCGPDAGEGRVSQSSELQSCGLGGGEDSCWGIQIKFPARAGMNWSAWSSKETGPPKLKEESCWSSCPAFCLPVLEFWSLGAHSLYLIPTHVCA
jgi:hypothetical protein